MERFADIQRMTTGDLQKVNAVRLYLRVITITDLAHPSRGYIPDGMLTRHWQAGATFEWQHQPYPRRLSWALFRKYLWLTFLQMAPACQRANYSMKLNTILGKYYPVVRNTWFLSYNAEEELFYQDQDTRKFQDFCMGEAGFYTNLHNAERITLRSHPLCFQQVSQAF